LNEEQHKDEIDQHIIEIVKEQKPENIKKLIQLIQEKSSLSDQEILNRILDLQAKEKIHLSPNQTLIPQKLTGYMRSTQASWYWTTIIITMATALLVFTIPENAFPLAYLRYVLGSIFVLWLPGYTFIKALFPEKELDNIERAALSMGMSLALVPIVGLLLNYTPWGIRQTPITISLMALTFTFATAAIIREHQTKTTRPPKATA